MNKTKFLLRGEATKLFYKSVKTVKDIFNFKNRNRKIEEYFSKIEINPSLNRNRDKYYVEMQLLAFQLIRYLRMNDDENEHSNQGNWNWTYFKENLTSDDFQFLANKITGSLRPDGWEKVIKHWKISDGRKAEIESMTNHTFIEDDIGDSYLRIVYKPVNHGEIRRIVKKSDLKEAINEINSRVEIEYLRTEVVDYRE